MVHTDNTVCPKCKGDLKRYDKVKRTVLGKGRTKKYITIRRLRCRKCGRIHREIPLCLFPFKHYDAGIITDVLEGHITSETLGYEDYPCEATIARWLARKTQILLWNK
jgi:uncharacterized protein YbaR (Trm112 family)